MQNMEALLVCKPERLTLKLLQHDLTLLYAYALLIYTLNRQVVDRQCLAELH